MNPLFSLIFLFVGFIPYIVYFIFAILAKTDAMDISWKRMTLQRLIWLIIGLFFFIVLFSCTFIPNVPSWSAIFPFVGTIGWVVLVLIDPWFAISERFESDLFGSCSDPLTSGDKRKMKGTFLGKDVALDAKIVDSGKKLQINSLKVMDQDFELEEGEKLDETILTIKQCQVPKCGWMVDLNDNDIGSKISSKTPLKKICINKKDDLYTSVLELELGSTTNEIVLREER
jgi:hypothetical protein